MSFLYGVSFHAYYTAWDTSTNSGKTGDKANHTVKISKDGGTTTTLTNNGHVTNHVELANGEYSILVTAAEAQADTIDIFGASSTASVILIPFRIAMIRLPNVDPAASGGLPTVDASNAVKVQSGTGANQFDLLSGAPKIQAGGLKKNTAFTAMPFVMRDSTTKLPMAGLTVSVSRLLDGGSFGVGGLTGITDKGSGVYTVSGIASDTNGTYITFIATAAGADPTIFTVITLP